ncbi:hypothetical protein SKAU_G00414870 [Synaphobranchus kaupii]|uniref:Uncharacterized protein n=1 Tax=Synaphobranchus kaupii TaxID=118154 RepID=A0A9Q1IBF2_SYNKA|nr:hypothetical protein SKAU_G00414870 [Synaphobranchus kaupii]
MKPVNYGPEYPPRGIICPHGFPAADSLPAAGQVEDAAANLQSLWTTPCSPTTWHPEAFLGMSMKDPELIAAAILLPKFRTCWITEESILKPGLDYIKGHLTISMDDDAPLNDSHSDEDDFFASMKTGNSEVGELEKYLACPTTGGNKNQFRVGQYPVLAGAEEGTIEVEGRMQFELLQGTVKMIMKKGDSETQAGGAVQPQS